jgi:putative redox protein
MYRVEVAHSKDFVFKAKSAGHEFTIDAKGKEGMTPPDVLLASVASCLGVYVRKYVEGAKLELSGFKITAEAEFAQEPLSFKVINVSIDLRDAKLDERRNKALLEFIKNCPVHNTLKGDPGVEIKLV